MRFAASHLLIVAAVLIAACTGESAQRGASPRNDLAVVLVEPDGKVGTVVVQQGARETVLHGPYAAARIQGPGQVEPVTLSKREVDRTFGPALAALPHRPSTFLLHFVEGKDELTPDSKGEFARISAEITSRPDPEILVIGHADRVGGDQFNDALSMQRAERVRAQLIARGIPADRIQVSARGKRELLYPTAQGVAEPRNRRVEINVR